MKKAKQVFFVGHEPRVSGALGKLGELTDDLQVLLLKGLRAVPLAGNQCVANKQLARKQRVNPRVLHLAGGHDRQAKQHHSLEPDYRTELFLPVRVRVAALAEVAGNLFGPGGVDGGIHARVECGGLNQFGAHDRVWRLLGQPRSRKNQKLLAV